jgi:hypothetical protein
MNMETEKRTNMVHHNEYVAGWLDSSVEDFLAAFPRTTESAAYALITCLDSNMKPASLLKKQSNLRVAMNGVTALNKGLLFPSKLLHKAGLRSQLFVGFDEIWFFPTAKIDPKPESPSIVGPDRIDQETLEKLGHWMAANGCSLALGDGMGLNIIVKAHGLMKCVIGHSLFQPEPTVQMSDLWVQDEEKKSSTARQPKYRSIDDT